MRKDLCSFCVLATRDLYSVFFLLAAVLCALAGGTPRAWASPAPTSITLALTSGGSSVSVVDWGTAVTLTANVTASGSPVTLGQVDFCDALASSCTDIHLVGSAQLTKGGTAVLKFVPAIGNRSYKAVFRKTISDATSTSGVVTLRVTGQYPTATTIVGSDNGNYSYTLTGTVAGTGYIPPTGTVSFLNSSAGGTVLGTADLVAGVESVGFDYPPFRLPGVGDPLTPFLLGVDDFNGDGIPDIVKVNAGQPPCPVLIYNGCTTINTQVAVLVGDGKGGFTAGSQLDVGQKWDPHALFVGDFNHDGLADLEVEHYQVDHYELVFFQGNGDGTFSMKGSTGTGATSGGFAVGDFDGDGILDLAHLSGDIVTILAGRGDGTFSPSSAAVSPAGSNPSAIVSGDFNGDGILDLAVTNDAYPTTTVTILIGNGDGSFKSAAAQPTCVYPTTIAAADFNNDGKVDLAIGNGTKDSGDLMVLLGNGDGTFAATTCSATTGAMNLFVGDFNGDGKPDLGTWYGRVLLGNGDGTFLWGGGGSYGTVAGPDLNGDGFSDLVGGYNTQTDFQGWAALARTQTATATANGIVLPVATGAQQVMASYSGDANYIPSVSSPTTLNSAKGTPTLSVTSSPNPASYGMPVTLTVAVSGPGATPTGNVTLLDGSAQLSVLSLNSSGVAKYTASALEPRVHSFTANYAGDSAYTGALSPAFNLTVNKGTLTATLTTSVAFSTVGAPVTFTLTFTGGATMPTGTVTFLDGSTTLGQSSINSSGVATYTTSSLAAGAHSITASYAGDANYASSTSTSTTVTASASPFFAVSGTTVSVTAGAATGNTSTITVMPAQGFVGSVTLTAAVTSSPAGAQFPPTVSFGSASTLNITSATGATATLTISTTGSTRAALESPKRRGAPWCAAGSAMLACLLMFGIPAHRRRWTRLLGMVLLLSAVTTGVLACGGGSSGPSKTGTTPGIYAVTVTGTSGVLTQQGAITLNVQ